MICSSCGSDVPTNYVFCLQCGTSVNQSSPPPPPTAQWTAYSPETVTTNRPTAGHSQPKPRASIGMLALYIVCGMLSIFGGLVLYNMYQGKDSSQEAKQNSETKQNLQDRNQNYNSINATKETRTETPPPSVTPTQNSAVTPPYTPPVPTSSSGEKIWYVMLGGFKDTNMANAATRLNYIRQHGYNAYMVDTNDYQNFDPNLHAVVMGPYTKSDAESMANQLRPIQPDVYIKWAK